ncbi:helix-turn-helix domain-containing protein [Shouchella patagoniensis]|uniref:helix-turn-helix domain-containing protein n=1 Tax=Shouchella patagoniensis TaxID=228576 RepID=UPI0009958278|nr:helix-turn-helix domain-containing protein [Shouchella patagoniensis]
MYITKLKDYATHADVAELNTTIYAALDDQTLPLNATDHALLRLLGGHSCRVPGVSWLRVDTMARIMERSDRTIRRSLARLVDCGIIERFKVGKLAVVRILSVEVSAPEIAETSVVKRDLSVISRTETTLSSEAHKSVSKDVAREGNADAINEVLPADFTPDYVSPAIIKTLAPFFGAEKISKIHQRIQLAYDKAALLAPLKDYDGLVCRTLKTVVFAMKTNRVKGDLYAYVYGTFRNVLTVQKRQEVRERQPFAAWMG